MDVINYHLHKKETYRVINNAGRLIQPRDQYSPHWFQKVWWGCYQIFSEASRVFFFTMTKCALIIMSVFYCPAMASINYLMESHIYANWIFTATFRWIIYSLLAYSSHEIMIFIFIITSSCMHAWSTRPTKFDFSKWKPRTSLLKSSPRSFTQSAVFGSHSQKRLFCLGQLLFRAVWFPLSAEK